MTTVKPARTARVANEVNFIVLFGWVGVARNKTPIGSVKLLEAKSGLKELLT